MKVLHPLLLIVLAPALAFVGVFISAQQAPQPLGFRGARTQQLGLDGRSDSGARNRFPEAPDEFDTDVYEEIDEGLLPEEQMSMEMAIVPDPEREMPGETSVESEESSSGSGALVIAALSDPPPCSAGYADCSGGISSADCKAKCVAIGGTCCDSTNRDCKRIDARVCADGSCSGDKACEYTEADYIVNSCKGAESCSNAGFSGRLPLIIDSCNEKDACYYAAFTGWIVGGIKSSCNAVGACYRAASATSIAGCIKGSCNAKEACYRAGSIAGLSLSCNSARACYELDNIPNNELEGCCNTKTTGEGVGSGICESLDSYPEDECEAPSSMPSQSPTQSPRFETPAPVPPAGDSDGPGTWSWLWVWDWDFNVVINGN